jgi:hypothetical protein
MDPRRKKQLTLFVTITVLFIFVSTVLYCVRPVPGPALTEARMYTLRRAILTYAQTYNSLPSSLSDLRRLPSWDGTLTDDKGRQILYSVSNGILVILKSSSLTKSFNTKDVRGSWLAPSTPWDD